MRLALAAVVAVAASSVLPLAPASAAECDVTVQLSGYAPTTKTVAPGATVHWCWNESNHSVTSNTNAFDSGVLDSGATFDHVFTTSGTYTYHCTVHGSMVATIVVQASATPSPTHTSAPPHSTTSPPAPRPTTTAPHPVTTTPARTSPSPARISPPVTTAPAARPPTSPPARAVGTPALTASPAPGTTPLAGTAHRSGRTTVFVLAAALLLGAAGFAGLRRRSGS